MNHEESIMIYLLAQANRRSIRVRPKKPCLNFTGLRVNLQLEV